MGGNRMSGPADTHPAFAAATLDHVAQIDETESRIQSKQELYDEMEADGATREETRELFYALRDLRIKLSRKKAFLSGMKHGFNIGHSTGLGDVAQEKKNLRERTRDANAAINEREQRIARVSRQKIARVQRHVARENFIRAAVLRWAKAKGEETETELHMVRSIAESEFDAKIGGEADGEHTDD